MKLQNKILHFFINSIFLLMANLSLAHAETQKPVFIIKPQGTLPSTVSPGESVQARYTVTNNIVLCLAS